MTDSLEILFDFERASAGGITAVEYWSTLEAAAKSVDLLVDMLLIEVELKKQGALNLCDRLRLIQSAGGSDREISDFVSGTYEQMVHTGAKPHLEEFSDLPEKYRKDLRASSDPFHLGQRLARRYYVEQRMGHGNFGVVYKVYDSESWKKLACKTPHRIDGRESDSYTMLLANESIAMGQLAEYGCPRVYDVMRYDDHPLILMEFVEGASLRNRISNRTLHPTEAARILAATARTLAAGHAMRIVHRDLKPENVLIDQEDRVYVVDFGLVVFGDKVKIQRDERIAGTRDYIPPEQLLGAPQWIDGRADIFAIGVMLYEILTGALPRRASSGKEDVRGFQAAELVWPGSVPEQLRAICQRCVDANLEDSYSSADDLADDLEAFLRSRSAESDAVKQLFIWNAGLLLGQFIHLYSLGEEYLDRVRTAPPDDDHLAMLLITFSAASEIASKVLYEFRAALPGGADFLSLRDLCANYPGATELIQRSLFKSRYRRTLENVEEWAESISRWMLKCFDAVQSISEAEDRATLARFEFAIVAAQASNQKIVTLGRLRSLAEETEIPSNLWNGFLKIVQDPKSGDLGWELLRLSRAVRRFLLQGTGPESLD